MCVRVGSTISASGRGILYNANRKGVPRLLRGTVIRRNCANFLALRPRLILFSDLRDLRAASTGGVVHRGGCGGNTRNCTTRCRTLYSVLTGFWHGEGGRGVRVRGARKGVHCNLVNVNTRNNDCTHFLAGTPTPFPNVIYTPYPSGYTLNTLYSVSPRGRGVYGRRCPSIPFFGS